MRRDIDFLQGSWAVRSLQVDGQKLPEAMLADARIVVAGARFTSTGMGAPYKGKLALDASGTPRKIDLKFDSGPEKGNTNRGIYKLEGDTWKLCLATRGSDRPSRFASTPGSGFALETLTRGAAAGAKKATRVKKAAAASARAASVTELEGEWRMLSGVMDGVPMDSSLVKWVTRETHGNQTTVHAGPQVMLKVEFTSDPSKSPKTIDYLNTAGANKGKVQKGIYKREGDRLTVCVSAPGAPRPTGFETQPSDKRTLTAWKRA